ncbi:MAG: gamma carbonic anhydrase family protein [Phycisphaeraceae bacterium]|nr:gamma carbonic anhydrase family protein [Phycisphaeraceae bacterium]
MRQFQRAYLADTARVLGEVRLGDDVSVWYGAVIRGDVAAIDVGASTNIQDNAVLHCDHGKPLTIGSHVTIGHGAVVHGLRVGDGSLIGMSATLLGGTVVGCHCLIAAGAVLAPGMEIPDGMVAMGVPAKIVRPITDEERRYMDHLPGHYVRLAQLHAQHPDDPRVRAITCPPA